MAHRSAIRMWGLVFSLQDTEGSLIYTSTVGPLSQKTVLPTRLGAHIFPSISTPTPHLIPRLAAHIDAQHLHSYTAPPPDAPPPRVRARLHASFRMRVPGLLSPVSVYVDCGYKRFRAIFPCFRIRGLWL